MPSADWKVEIVDSSGEADYSVTVIGDQVVDLTGATPGQVLTVQPDGTVAAASLPAAASQVAQTITNGVTTTAPSQDAVFDALTLVVHLAGAETISGAKTFTAIPTAGDATNVGGLIVNGPAATLNDINFQRAGLSRWRLRVDATAESGSSVGSNFQLISRKDDGTAHRTVLTALRSGPVGIGPSTLVDATTTPFLTVTTNSTTGPAIRSQLASGSSQDLAQFADATPTVLLSVTSAGLLKWNAAGNQQTTVGAAGAASALPATPTKYLKVVDSTGTTLVIPAYAA